jgi:hypothetical protein
MRYPECQALLPQRFYELFGAKMPTKYEFYEWNLSLD